MTANEMRNLMEALNPVITEQKSCGCGPDCKCGGACGGTCGDESCPCECGGRTGVGVNECGMSVYEGGMPSSVIKSKQRFDAMTPEEFRERMDSLYAEKGITDDAAKEEHLRKMAWRHGYGKMASNYYDKYTSGISEDVDDNEEFDWQSEMETGVVITDNTRGGYDLSAEGKSIGNFSEWDDVMFAATQWMEQNQYWPNIFFVNDHGNVTHIDKDGNEINSIVEQTSITERTDSDPVLNALSNAYLFITQPQKMETPKGRPTILTYHTSKYNELTQQLRDAIQAQKGSSLTEDAGMDEFCQAYIEAALWSSTDNADEQGGEPLDRNYGPEDLSDETLQQMKADCDAFQETAGDAIAEDISRAGHDFWLTRNGHGAGFWDGDWEEPAASQLTALSKRFGEVDLYVGDDGMLYS